MWRWLSTRTDYSRTAREIYGSIVASARQETFYAVMGVPDSREGRFEMLTLHMALVMLRLGGAGPAGVDLSRSLAETFITDMDDNMREIGIGDLAVPRKIKRAAAALYDRHRDYGAALAGGNSTETTAAISRYVGVLAVGKSQPGIDCDALARYTTALADGLASASDEECLAGRVPLPSPIVLPSPTSIN